jgi:hypothetical protein
MHVTIELGPPLCDWVSVQMLLLKACTTFHKVQSASQSRQASRTSLTLSNGGLVRRGAGSWSAAREELSGAILSTSQTLAARAQTLARSRFPRLARATNC